MAKDVKKIIEKWYKIVNFDPSYDAEFYKMLDEVEIPEDCCIETYGMVEEDGRKNLLAHLYFCEALEKKYEEKGISHDIFIDSIQNLRTVVDKNKRNNGLMIIGQPHLHWFWNFFTMITFKLGRLIYCIDTVKFDVPEKGLVRRVTNVIDMHIPEGGPLKPEMVEESLEMAREFFDKYYPEHEYEYFTCWTWLTDETLKMYLPEDSNIIRFQNVFENVFWKAHNGIMSVAFGPGTTKENIKDKEAKTTLEKAVRTHIMNNGTFYTVLGLIKK